MLRSWASKLLVAIGIALFATGATAHSAAGEVVVNEWQGFVTFPVNTCNGETVFVLGGVAHYVLRLQPDGSVVTKWNGHFTETGSLGNRYQMNWQERFKSSSTQTTYSSRQLIVSAGSEPNHIVTFTFASPPGTFTAVEDCRG